MEVDVVVCVKNRAAALDAVLSQIVQEIPFRKLIVVYGSSVDATKETAEKYTEAVFWDGDKGLGAARNLGMAKANAQIVAMIDSDVLLTKGWYQQLIPAFQDDKVAAVMGTCLYGYGCKPLESYSEYLRRKETANFGCSNTMFRRKAVLDVGNFSKEITGAGEDYDLYLRLLKAGYEWLWVKQATVLHPMTLLEYMHHFRWWARSVPQIEEVKRSAVKVSLLRVYLRQFFLVITDAATGIALSKNVHPIWLFLSPLRRGLCVLETIKTLKEVA